MDLLLIFNKGFPGNLVAPNLDGIMINVFINTELIIPIKYQ